jgi:hypothetical protein
LNKLIYELLITQVLLKTLQKTCNFAGTRYNHNIHLGRQTVTYYAGALMLLVFSLADEETAICHG